MKEGKTSNRGLAIILSPTIAIFIYSLTYILLPDKRIDLIFFIFLILCIFAIFVQYLIEIILFFISKLTKITLKIYLTLGYVICVFIGIWNYFDSFVSNEYDKLTDCVKVFFMFFIYVIINSITYNYLYFSKLENETSFPVIPTKEGTGLITNT